MLLHRRGDERDAEAGGDEADERGGLGDFVGGDGFEAVGGARVLDGVVDDGAEVRRVGDERLAGEHLERDGVLAGERVRFVEHGDERFGAQDLGAEVAIVDGRAQEAEVERAVEQPGDLGGGEQFAAEVEHDAGQLVAQCSGDRGQRGVGHRSGEADGQAPVLAARGAACVLDAPRRTAARISRPRSSMTSPAGASSTLRVVR